MEKFDETEQQPGGAKQSPQIIPDGKLNGRYLIERELGHGGIGVVYLGRDERTHGSQVVIKMLLPTLPPKHKDWFEKKFKGESAALARIDHPGVVRVLDQGELSDGRSYLVMQYVNGVNLRSIMSNEWMELERTADLVRQIGQALTAAHEKGVIHRDLKPENIMLQKASDDEEYVKLIDFGIATVQETPVDANMSTTAVAGTYAYMAPEQLKGKPTAASDVFAFGVIAYEMLTGQLPFKPEYQHQMLELQKAGVRDKPCDLRAELSLPAQEAILKALSFEQQDRYARAKDFGEALARALLVDARMKTESSRFEKAAAENVRRNDQGEFGDRQMGESIRSHLSLKQEHIASKSSSKITTLTKIGLLLVAAAIVALIVWQYLPQKTTDSGANQIPPTAISEHRLNYWLTAMRNPKRYRGSTTFDFVGEETIFGAGDEVRLNITSPRTGFLYVINEGPDLINGRLAFNVLFPVMTTNNGSAVIAANRQIQIPPPYEKEEENSIGFDKEKGVEKLWIVWSENSIPVLEEIKKWANVKDRGELRDINDIDSVARFFAAQSPTIIVPEKDEANKRMVLKGRGAIIIGLVKLEHR
jgi:serine/threonine protein kinase